MTQALKKIPFKIWFFVFAVLFCIFTVASLPKVGALDSAAVAAEKYDHDATTLREAVTSYHEEMNDIMNEFTKKLLSLDDPKERAEKAGPPTCGGEGCANASEAEKYCDGNVSTFCLAVQMTNEYMGFREALMGNTSSSHIQWTDDRADHKEKLLENIESSKIISLYFSGARIEDSIERLNARTDLIQEQVLLAKDVMDVALGTYNQIQMYYELHVAYTGIIGDLETYRDELSKVRKQVEEYPGKFHNVTTTECT